MLPLFALANAGVAIRTNIFAGRERLSAAIIAGLVVGKPLVLRLPPRLRLRSSSPSSRRVPWAQLLGAGALAEIGFTMSLFIAGQAFPAELDFEAAKIAVFAASILSAAIGMAILVIAARNGAE